MSEVEIVKGIITTLNLFSLGVLITYALRQYVFMFASLRHKESDNLTRSKVEHTVTVLIPARNEEKVIGRTLEFMSKLKYPKDKLEVLVLDDASKDSTSKIAHEWASKFNFIRVIDRPIGGLGKGDVLNQGVRESKNEIILIFDADYTPAPDTVKRLVRWFDDPKIGLVQGKIHVVNKDENMLTKMIHTERCAGFLCDLFARDKLRLSNQYGGTAGGFRRELITKVGEWTPDTYCEDTDLTCRTLLAGYKVKYDVSVSCGEEAPDKIKVYYKQRYRWTRGHVLCALKYSWKFIRSPFLSFREKVDGVLWLNVNAVPILAVVGVIGWLITIITAITFDPIFVIALTVASLSIGLSATLGTVWTGLYKVKQVNYLKFAVSMIANSYIMCYIVCMKAYFDIATNRPFKWIITERSGIVSPVQQKSQRWSIGRLFWWRR
jgi:cellulose synthase/poly-beta-1,6-N-acetylglucosamine synthase-like glycosyltransferase